MVHPFGKKKLPYSENLQMKHIKIKKIDSSHIDNTLAVCGWIRTVRQQKTFSFIELNDGSTLSNLQIVVDETMPHYAEVMKQLSTGAAICATGLLAASPGQKQKWELKASSITLLGACPEDYL